MSRGTAGSCILATGGAGFIGSHVAVALLRAGHKVVVLDNLENADRTVAGRIAELSFREVTFVEGDVRDRSTVEDVLRSHRVDAVIHLAGKKAVGESVADPLLYFHDNLNGAISLLAAMKKLGVPRLVFSSSATVYGAAKTFPIDEAAPTFAANPYGRSKLMIEEMIDDLAVTWPEARFVSLRYFNPVGAHPSGLIGESPRGIPNNLFPYIAQTAAGERDRVRVFGGDYETPDGTGVRDFIHVDDLARGHVSAIDLLLGARSGLLPAHQRINLGTGRGYSVLQVIAAFSEASGRQIPFEIVARRPGDTPVLLADPRRAAEILGWVAEHDLGAMCRDHWRFQMKKCPENTDRQVP